jgi:hypothetical protein
MTGCCIGTIDILGDCYWEKDYINKPFSEYKKAMICKWLQLAADAHDAEYGRRKNEISEAFWKIMIGGTNFQEETINPAVYRQMFDVATGNKPIPQEQSHLGENTREVANLQLSTELESPKTEIEKFQRYIAPFATKTTAMMINRMFFIARAGADILFGLVPSRTESGDRICVFPGCRYPIILRETGDCYVLIGAAYVHGFMNGEAMEMISAGKLAEKQFIVR